MTAAESPITQPPDTESPATEPPDADQPDAGSPEYAAATKQALGEDVAHLKAAAPPPDPLTVEQKAQNLISVAPATYLYAALSGLVGPAFNVPVYQLYLASFLAEAGAPADPIERMLLEQLALAHHVVGRLHAHAGTRGGLGECTAYHAAAARLMGEFRRTALALKAYRHAPAARPARARKAGKPAEKRPLAGVNGHVAHGQAAYGHGGNGQAARNGVIADGQAVQGHAVDGNKTMSDGELGSNNRLKGFFHERACHREPSLA
jgi:hypothetical protein